MADIGKYNTLNVLEKCDHGLYLDGGEHDRILMPTRYVMPEMTVGSGVECFVYNDS
ncbi:MAG: S1 RNA-binding domain-containing protein, partial [Verrucomicrobiota bacterium]|nr:S1 RNA-binding domain-containing protein [Verrucomicrobiota bacterium]